MTSFGVSLEREKELRRTMHSVQIFEKDIQESFIRSSGPGGQNVNKVATCVVLYHYPTGIQVRSQEARSQGLNRYKARCRLIAKVKHQQETKRKKAVHDREKRKRQNRKRSKASKEKMLEGKRQQSERKKSRRKIRTHKLGDYL